MATSDFAHLHLHTQYSFLDGAIRIKDLIARTAELGMSSVAVTDHGNMFGAVDFYQQAKAGGIKPIMGMEAYITATCDHTHKIRQNHHLILLAENNQGYQNLKKLSSIAFTHGKYYFPRIDKALLRKYREGIIATTACLGSEVSSKCAKGDLDGARESIREFKDILGPDHFFLEVQPSGEAMQEKVNSDLAQLSRDENVRLIASNDCHYVTRDQHDAQNILMAIRQQKSWNDPSLHRHETDAFYIRSGEEMHTLLRGDYMSGYESACEVAKRCNVEIDLGNTYLPPFPFPAEYKDEPGYLGHLATEGLKKRCSEVSYPIDLEQYKKRLDHELGVIIQMGFPGYFLIVQDFINWAKNNRIWVGPGRGSGAGSLVAWALRITDIDPIPYHLLFERFLNPERVSMPDFDIDFMQERRGEVINYVAEKYGREKVGQIATYSALNPKSAIKDVARVLDLPFAEVNELTKPMPILVDGKKPDLEQSLDYAPKLRQLAKTDPTYRRVLDTARILEGLYRQAGMHAGGVVIGKNDLVEYVPIFSGANGETVTQFDKDKVEAAGLVKFDFLGLKTLDVIAHAEGMVRKRIKKENKLPDEIRAKLKLLHPHAASDHGEVIPDLRVDLLEPTNAKIFELISSGDTLGVFQVESSGFQDMCRKLKPDCFEDIVAAVALYRPGPMQSGMVDDFIARKHGRMKVEYPHPSLEEVLKPTYGTFVYQEQVMQSAQVLAGYTLGSADILRRAMGKKNFEQMQKQRQLFVAGASNKGVTPDNAAAIFDTIEKFAGYGFNKSHSAAYAMITYQTAYLKCFYPIEFRTALLTVASGSTDDVVKYIHEARTSGIEVKPPDINISERRFAVEYRENYWEHASKNKYGHIRFGLEAVKGLGEAALESLIEARTENPYKNLFHLCDQVPIKKINKKVLEALIKSGAMDSFGRPRRQLFESVESALSSAQKMQKDRSAGQTNMFSMLAPESNSEIEEIYPPKRTWSSKEELAFEKEAIGFYLSGHPLDRYEADAKSLGAIPAPNLTRERHHAEVTIVGVVSELKERPLKSGKGRWAVIIAEDNFGQAEVLAFSKSYDKSEELLKSGEPLVFRGRALIDDMDDEGEQTTPKMRLEEVSLLSEAQIDRARALALEVHISGIPESKKTLEKIHLICSRYPGEKRLKIRAKILGSFQVDLHCGPDITLRPSDELISELEEMDSIHRVARI